MTSPKAQEAAAHIDAAIDALTAAACRADWRLGSVLARVIGELEQASQRLTGDT